MFALGTFALITLLGVLASIAALAVIVYAFYDLLVKRESMSVEEKLLWAVVILVFNFVGALVYLVAVWGGYTGLLDDRKLSELERLAELRDKDAITEEEYQELKEDLLEDMRRQG